ncbi:autotransporter outer membrane beta-barrel domain-containing protein [Polynucleobacter sp. MWH-S4W17]|uniref:beta strand repeat-containing protein n=1 Tax=Polynucleobacter sp. MWH-S4W17 TaxID=1855910 RepID=UPI001BFEA572|nr:autotransporter outer membrane beta-barrel domain-containing protein [Polynucleobacter sp. MWH-S4W17]QWD82571.1 autotransporter outer membrane beta-barrel domain-containing protein [Polynucleobacter sp. MWH-S4W17]
MKFKLSVTSFLVLISLHLSGHAVASCLTPTVAGGTQYAINTPEVTDCIPVTNATTFDVNSTVVTTSDGFKFSNPTQLTSFTNLGIIFGAGIGVELYAGSNAKISTLNNGSSSLATAYIGFDPATTSYSGTGISLYSGSEITTLNNYGTIAANLYSIQNIGGTIGVINNYNTVQSQFYDAINSSGPITSINNFSGGLIAGGSFAGSGINSSASITSINNSSGASITGSGGGYGIYNDGGSIGGISNAGTISGAWGIYNGAGGTIGTVSTVGISNAVGGQITSVTGYGIENEGSTIKSIVNSGTISGADFAIYNHNNGPAAARIDQITNWGALTGSLGGINNNNGLSSASIGTLNNAQSGLKYFGVMPTNYNIIITPTGFGTLDAGLGITGSTTFGVSSLSTLSANTYSGVLLGVDSLGITNYSSIFNTWTNFNSSYKWELIAGANSTTWNLVVAALAPPPPVATNITGAGTIYQSSNLGTTVNPVFDGGTLQVSSTGNIANNFTVNGNNGVIDQNSVASNFTGMISNASAGSPGSITITNSGSGGSVTFSGENTYTGSTTINNGATLALSGAGSVSQSSGVTNNGTFNIAGKTGNVSVASYTQGATGTLSMGIVPSNSPKLNVNGVASLAGGLSLTASSGSYAPGKYTLLTANGGVTGSFGNLTTNLSSYTRLGYGLAYDANDVYLIFTPNVADTQQSLVNTASALQNIYTLQNSVLANSFSYDCNEFGANGVCISVGGRNTAVSAANGLNNTSGLLIAAYRPHRNYRIGAYVDQNLSVNNAGSTVNLGNNTPLIGLFGAWNERVDGTGTEVKVSAAYGQKNTTINRQVVGTSEAGSGSSQLNSQGAQVTAKYGFAALPAVIVSPYIGIRYTQNNMGGYTEGTSATVTAPLTYSALNTNATTALAGLGASYRFIPKATLFASAGVETDTNTANGTYSATGLTGLTPINFNANPVKTRPTATIGAYYDVEKNQRVGVTGIYRQEPFQAVQTTTVMATYTVGL